MWHCNKKKRTKKKLNHRKEFSSMHSACLLFCFSDSWYYPEGKNKKCESQFQIESTFCKEWLNINQFDCEYMCVKLLVPNKCDLKNDQEFLKNDTENLEKFTKCKAFTWDSENLICKMFTECGEIEETLKPIFVYVL
jgi:GTPase SAR1 family protein